jgi:arabinose-5-phosphate isomerase
MQRTTQTPTRPVQVTVTDHSDTTDPTEAIAYARQILSAEANAVMAVADHLDEGFGQAVDMLVQTVGDHASVVVAGMGKSGLIGQKISATLSSVGLASHFVHPAEAVHGDLGRFNPRDCALILSYSGNTDEAVALASILKQDNIGVISITKGAGAPLDRLATVALSIGTVEEACGITLAPTSSTTATLALGDALALTASRRLNFSADDFRKRHPGGWLGELLRPVTDVLRFTADDNLTCVPTGTPLIEALRQTSVQGRRPGAMVVVDADGRLIGLFTDGDLRRLILRDAQELSKPVDDVMTHSPRTLPDTAVLREALQLVREFRADEIPVVDHEGKPVGILDVQDLLAMKIAQQDT